MFKKWSFPKNLLTYIGENRFLLEIIVMGIVLLLVLIVLFQVTRLKRDIRRITRQVKKYLDVVLAEDTEEEEEEVTKEETSREMADIQEIHTYHKRKEQAPPKKSLTRAEEELKNQRDAQLLMDVISDVF